MTEVIESVCVGCGAHEDTRFGWCFGCATEAENKLVEKVARAIYDADYFPAEWEENEEEKREIYRTLARAAIEAIESERSAS